MKPRPRQTHNPECACCIDPAANSAWEAECMRKNGWYGHWVVDYTDGYHNCHTHGFEKTLNHMNFQSVMPLTPEMVHSFFWRFVDRIKAGEKFVAGQKVSQIIGNGFDVLLIEAFEVDRKVLRIIYPDKNGRFPGDPGCDPKFAGQATVRINGEVIPESN